MRLGGEFWWRLLWLLIGALPAIAGAESEISNTSLLTETRVGAHSTADTQTVARTESHTGTQTTGKWLTSQSPRFAIHYDQGHQLIAADVIRKSEALMPSIEQKLDWQVKRRVQIVLTDQFDLANGWATFYPYPLMTLYLTKPLEGSLLAYDDWLTLLIEHELTHIVHLDRGEGLFKGARAIFGRNPALFPNAYLPDMLVEGLAVQQETKIGTGIGRGYGYYFEMLMRAEALSGYKSLEQVVMQGTHWPTSYAYLYGFYFHQFLQQRQSKAVEQYVAQFSEQWIPFFLNRGFKQALGTSMSALWPEFIQWLDQRFQPQLEQLRQHSLEVQPIGRPQFRISALGQTPQGQLVAVMADGKNPYSLVQIDPESQSLKPLAVVNRVRSISPWGTDELLLAMANPCPGGSEWFDMYRFNLKSKQLTRVSHCERIVHISRHPTQSKLAVIKQSGGETWVEIWWSEGEGFESQGVLPIPGMPISVAWVPGKTHTLAAITKQNQWQLGTLDTRNPIWQPKGSRAAGEQLVALNVDQEDQIVLLATGPESTTAPFSAGVSNVYGWDGEKRLQSQSHTLTGILRFQPFEHGHLLVQAAGEGEQLVWQPKTQSSQQFELQTIQPSDDAGSDANGPQPTLSSQPYGALKHLRPTWWMPWFQTDSQNLNAGVFTQVSDPRLAWIASGSLWVEENDAWVGWDLSLAHTTESGQWASRWLQRTVHQQTDSGTGYSYLESQLSAIQRWDKKHWHKTRQLYAGVAAKALGRWRDDQGNSLDVDTDYSGLLGTKWQRQSLRSYRYSTAIRHGSYAGFGLEGEDYSNQRDTEARWRFDLGGYLPVSQNQTLSLELAAAGYLSDHQSFYLGGEFESYSGTGLNLGLDEFRLRGVPQQFAGDQLVRATANWHWQGINVNRSWLPIASGLRKVSMDWFSEFGTGPQISGLLAGAGVQLNADLDIGYNLLWRVSMGAAVDLNDSNNQGVYVSFGPGF